MKEIKEIIDNKTKKIKNAKEDMLILVEIFRVLAISGRITAEEAGMFMAMISKTLKKGYTKGEIEAAEMSIFHQKIMEDKGG